MKFLIAFLLFSGLAFAQGCPDKASCPQECPATIGSLTPATITGTSPSVICWRAIQYNSNFAGNVFDIYAPTGCTAGNCRTTQVIVCWHGGGNSGGNRESCFGNGLTTYSPVSIVQQYNVIIIEPDYRLATSPGTNPWPANVQDAHCLTRYYIANASSFPGSLSNWGSYGPSWGGELSFAEALIPEGIFTEACPTGAQTLPKFRAAMAWTAMSFALPSGNATYDNNSSGLATTAIQNTFNCSSAATCRTADTSLQGSLYQQIVNTNTLLTQPTLFQFGDIDTTVEPTWSAGAGGNRVQMLASYAALTSPPQVFTQTLVNCAHECDLNTSTFAPSQISAFNFLTSAPTAQVSGAAVQSGKIIQ